MPELIYHHRAGLILIEKEVVTTLSNWRQTGRQPEAGGILIGYRRTPHIHVTACTTPFPKDKRSRIQFLRRDPRHVCVARNHWQKTNGEAYYLGDWHTHPVGIPKPSSVDLKEWRILMKTSLGPELLFVIIGKSKWYVQLKNSPVTKCRTTYVS